MQPSKGLHNQVVKIVVDQGFSNEYHSNFSDFVNGFIPVLPSANVAFMATFLLSF